MSKQQKYQQQVQAILKSNPSIKLADLIRSVINLSLSNNDIQIRLLSIQLSQYHQENYPSLSKCQGELGQTQASGIQTQQLLLILVSFQQLNKKLEDEEQFKQQEKNLKMKQLQKQLSQAQPYSDNQFQGYNQEEQPESKPKLKSKDKYQETKNQERKSSDKKQNKYKIKDTNQQNSNQESQDQLPNFQNQKQFEEFMNDHKNHKNLFDDKPFEFVEEPPQQIKRTQSFYSKQYSNLKQKIKKYLIGAYHEYIIQAYNALDAEQPDQNQKKHLMDLRMFLKFYKDFQMKEFLKANQVMKIFKKEALNRIWADLDRFLQINYQIIQHKSVENSEEAVKIANQQELIQRGKKFLSLFSREKIKKYLKVTNKQSLQKIIQEETKKDEGIHQVQGNKGEIVDKFLKRNFDGELMNWYNKKEINLQKIGKLKKKAEPSKNKQKKRNERSISDNIQKLRSQSEKSIKQLRNLLQEDFESEESSKGRNDNFKDQKFVAESKSVDLKEKKAPLKSKHTNISSAYKQIQGYNEEHFKSLKSNKNDLKEKLNISEDEPYLKAYFNKEIGLINNLNSPSNIIGKPKADRKNDIVVLNKKNTQSVRSIKKRNYSNLLKNPERKLNKKDDEPFQLLKIKQADLLKVNRKSPKRQESDARLIYLRDNKSKINEFGSRQEDIHSIIRNKNNKSQPSYSNKRQNIAQDNRKRVQSMKKLLSKQKSQNSIENIQQELISAKLGKKENGIGKLKQNGIMNKKLYKFLEQHEIELNQRLKKGSNDRIQKPKYKMDNEMRRNNQDMIKKPEKEDHKGILQGKKYSKQLKSSRDIQEIKKKNSLMLDYEEEVYQLFKYFKKRSPEQDQIVNQQNQKRKGHHLGVKRQSSIRKINNNKLNQ